MNIRQLKRVIGVCLLGGCTPLSAAIFEPGVGLGWQYSDNAALTPDNEDADWGAVGYLGGLLQEEDGPLQYDVDGTVVYQRYANNTFDDQTYFNFRGRSRWEQVENRLNWIVEDFFTQRPISTLGRNVPTNIEDTNIFNFAADIAFPFASGHRFWLRPSFQDYYFEERDNDNQQYGLDAGWSYPMYPTLRVGIDARATDVNYDQGDGYTRSHLRAVASGSRPHSEYTLSLGGSRISRDNGNDQSGPGGALTYLYNITGRSSVRAHVGSQLTDSSQAFFESEVDPGNGNPDNVQASRSTFRDNLFTLSYRRDGDTFDARIWGELRDLDYEEVPRDREVQELGTDLDYKANAYLSTGVYGSYVRLKETDIDRTDKRYLLGGRVRYKFSRKLTANVTLQYRKRDSTEDSFNYDEFTALVGIVYGHRGRTTGIVGDSLFRH